MRKLSELSNDTMLTVGNGPEIMTKEAFLDSAYFLDGEQVEVTIADKCVETFSFADLIEERKENNYEDWDEEVNRDISSEQWEILKKAEKVINEIFEGRPCFWEGKKVEVDIKIK